MGIEQHIHQTRAAAFSLAHALVGFDRNRPGRYCMDSHVFLLLRRRVEYAHHYLNEVG
jgi:hypothetical protein